MEPTNLAFYEPGEEQAPEASYQIYHFIQDNLNNKPKDTHINRASSASLCYKRRWYQKNGYYAEALTPRAIINFSLGDLTEHVLKYWISKGCIGPEKLYSEVYFGKECGAFTIQNGHAIKMYDQDDDLAQAGDYQITAHADGWGKRNSDGKWELIEIKSASNYGFKDFKTIGPKDYLKQAVVNLKTSKANALKANEVRFFFLKKDTGHIWDRVFPFSEILWKEVIKDFELANQKEEPKAPYQPGFESMKSRRLVLTYPCTYCPYSHHCQPAYEIEFKKGFDGGMKPVYVLKEKK